MLRANDLQHPRILEALAAAGHGSRILITDGNFPHNTAPLASAPRVYLNLAPGKMTVDDVLEAVVPAIPIESVALMMDENSASAPEAHSAIRSLLPDKVPVELVDRATFFAASKSSDLALVIATADPRHFACVLLTIGVL